MKNVRTQSSPSQRFVEEIFKIKHGNNLDSFGWIDVLPVTMKE